MSVSAKVVTSMAKGEERCGRDTTGLNRGYRYRQSRGKPLRAVSEAYRSCAARTPKQGGLDPFNCRDNVGIRVKTHQTSARNDHVQEFPLSFNPPYKHSRFRPCTLLLRPLLEDYNLKMYIDIGQCHFLSYSSRLSIVDPQFDCG